MARDWSPASWRGHEARQQPAYADAAALAAALKELAAYPPLVPAAEAHALKAALAEAQAGRAFLLQGGDCAESFAEFAPENVRLTVALIAAVARRLAEASGLRVVRVARIAGQFAKPRSRAFERKGGRALPVYRGDIVNGAASDESARSPDPERMFRAYAQSAATLSHLAAGAGPEPVWTSHEALLLPYEEALVRRDGAGWYGSSAPFLWIGDRTRFEGSAHVELLRGLTNPIGIKCGPSLGPALILRLLDRLNPMREPGRITLISRMGSDRLGSALPPLLGAVRAEGHPVLWCCDPMHGNTRRARGGHKTRPMAAILAEVDAFFAACRAEGVHPGGLHVEMTGRDVAECTGGIAGVTERDLVLGYRSQCDPRLNPAQAAEVAQRVAGELERGRGAAAA
ncbi:MAG: 3-deoxy-7-phosphoheptulonate synthase [Sphingomonadales bacterium]|jgi:3-deoxy-7-phosphoheptulonate synthase|nr:3-deoxy-7-phosphoheptulonate synthase [Sphingomonadales bacterium]